MNLASFVRRRGRRGAACDPADMGTAFGLDAITPQRVEVVTSRARRADPVPCLA